LLWEIWNQNSPKRSRFFFFKLQHEPKNEYMDNVYTYFFKKNKVTSSCHN
jgi:hypothetical protein